MRRRPLARILRLPRSADRIRADLEEEIQFDIALRARDLEASGLSPADARARAEHEFGDLDATRRYCEDLDMQREAEERRVNLLDDLRSDLTIAWRGMRRAPAFAAVVILTLALGIGANTAVYSVVRRVLLEPLPFRAPQQLYRLYTVGTRPNEDTDKLSAVELDMLARESKTLAGITEFGWIGSGTYSDDKVAEVWPTAMVAPNFFDVLGTRLARGRAFTSDEAQPGASKVAIISYARWQSNFGGDAHILERTIEMNGVGYRIVGVLPSNFLGPTFTADVVFPLQIDAALRNPRSNVARVYRGIARLRPGVTRMQLESDLAMLHPRLQAQYQQLRGAGAIIPKPLHAAIVGEAAPVLVLVMVGIGIVLVVTCVNIAGLFLSRAVARRRELGVRAALGAARGRLVRQVITESALYSVAGGLLGIGLAFVLKRAFLVLIAGLLPAMTEDVPLSTPLLSMALVASVLCGIVFGILPALAATRLDMRDALGDAGTRSLSAGRGAARGSRILVSAQIACAVVLVVGAGLLARTFMSLMRTDLGYEASQRQLAFGLNPTRSKYPDRASTMGLARTLTERLAGLPAVSAVGVTALTPWMGGMMAVPMRIEGRPVDTDPPTIQFATASPDYFSAMGVAVRSGRAFTNTDETSSPPVVIISEAVARRFWPNASPIGARVRIDTDVPGDSDRVREIVGVVADTRENVLSPITPLLYVPTSQFAHFSGTFVIRATRDAATLVPQIRDILHTIDPGLPLFYPRTVRAIAAQSMARQQLAMGLVAGFAILALLLAALGVYGIMAYTVVARTREFGIRSALGATRRSILGLVLRNGLAVAAAGIGFGLGLAALLSRFMASLLVGVSTHDALTFVISPIVLGVVSIVATVIPARVATRVHPVEALKAE